MERDVQISRGSSVAANSGTQRRNDPNHNENQAGHQKPHAEFLFDLDAAIRKVQFLQFKYKTKDEFQCDLGFRLMRDIGFARSKKMKAK